MNICFVCTGNTCRSVMAERIMKKQLKTLGVKDIKVSSKGLNATGENIAENAKVTLKAHGCLASNRKSVQLKKVDAKTVYIAMTDAHKAHIASKQVISFSELIGREVLDPYGQGVDVYMACFDTLSQGIQVLINKIIKMRGLL